LHEIETFFVIAFCALSLSVTLTASICIAPPTVLDGNFSQAEG